MSSAVLRCLSAIAAVLLVTGGGCGGGTALRTDGGGSTGSAGQGAASGAGGETGICEAGCLCFHPPQACPAGCYSSPTVYCSNGGPFQGVDGGGSSDAATSECQGPINCPAAIIGEVSVPSDLMASLTGVSTEAPCMTSLASGDAVEVLVDGAIPPGTMTTCQVHGTLSDGTKVVASISFQPLSGCCSSQSTAINSPAAFMRVGDKCATSGAGVSPVVVSNDPRCPSTWSSLAPNGLPAICSVSGLICTYPEGQGECAPDGAALKWWTDGASPACSETAPKVGSACGVPGLICEYITGPPNGGSGFTTNYCCDGSSCAWTVQSGGGCPNGNTCGAIQASDYDQSCGTDSDCVVEPEGDFCVANRCTDCGNAVVSVKAQAQYEADLASKISVPFDCPCPSGPRAVCNHGKCATASFP
jgi:hypothetical protein